MERPGEFLPGKWRQVPSIATRSDRAPSQPLTTSPACPTCKGTGLCIQDDDTEPEPCLACKGTGRDEDSFEIVPSNRAGVEWIVIA